MSEERIHELETKIQELEHRIRELEQENLELEQRTQQLEQKMVQQRHRLEATLDQSGQNLEMITELQLEIQQLRDLMGR